MCTGTVIKGIRAAMLISICLYDESAVLQTASGNLASHYTTSVRSIACEVRFFLSIFAWAARQIRIHDFRG
jgi:hypothetical protein